TPGALRPGVTLQQVLTPGYSRRVRPSRAVSFVLKLSALRRYRYPVTSIRQYTLDHLIPLECGGHPTPAANLLPELVAEAKVKDIDENAEHAALAAGTTTIEACAAWFVEKWTV